ncbi:MAG: sulfite exporter TauE/SafE family protein [Bacteroidetes bacterium]|nr:sulfite exporter TauE/SafE family protein [Bacteroidota bacterium]
MELITALMLGLAGSMHCAGMCGPIALALPTSPGPRFDRIAGRVLYQLGRISTYGALGAIIGLGGSAISMAGYGRVLSIVAGSLMIIAAVLQLLWHRSLLPSAFLHRVTAPVRSALAKNMTKRSKLTLYTIGVFNGLLPCGLVTAALLGAAGNGTVTGSAAFMAMFGLGTVPMMLGISLGGVMLGQPLRRAFRFAAPVIAVLVGSVIIVRGMALDIPYLSPPAPVEHGKVSCCDEQ